VNVTDAGPIAARLGIDESLVRRLQARGYLLSLPFDEREIRERLLLAHCSYIAGGGARPARRGLIYGSEAHWAPRHRLEL
jgi:hypothetical protein